MHTRRPYLPWLKTRSSEANGKRAEQEGTGDTMTEILAGAALLAAGLAQWRWWRFLWSMNLMWLWVKDPEPTDLVRWQARIVAGLFMFVGLFFVMDGIISLL